MHEGRLESTEVSSGARGASLHDVCLHQIKGILYIGLVKVSTSRPSLSDSLRSRGIYFIFKSRGWEGKGMAEGVRRKRKERTLDLPGWYTCG
jgi:hypothetical protein